MGWFLGLPLNKKPLFFGSWYVVLWVVCTWTLFEYFYPQSNYSASLSTILYLVAAGFSLLLLATTGIPLFLFVRKREIREKEALVFLGVFFIASVLLVSYLVPLANVSGEYKSRRQWYIDDLERHGFDVEYSPDSCIVKSSEYIGSYSEIIRIAREINSSTIYFHGKVPTYFLFFVEPLVTLHVSSEGHSLYQCQFSLDK